MPYIFHDAAGKKVQEGIQCHAETMADRCVSQGSENFICTPPEEATAAQLPPPRVRVTNCPPYHGRLREEQMASFLNYDGQKWVILLVSGFKTATISQNLPYPAVVTCDYGPTINLEIPREYVGRTCSFKQDSMVKTCDEKDPKKCVVYCEKREEEK